MKKLILLFSILLSQLMVAQFVNPESRPHYPNPKKGEKTDPVTTAVTYLKKELVLDDFQTAAIKIMISDNQKEAEKIMELPLLDNEKIERIKNLREKLNPQIKTMLSEEQVKKFEDILQLQEGKNVKKKKKE